MIYLGWALMYNERACLNQVDNFKGGSISTIVMMVSNNTLCTNRTTIIPYHLKRCIVVQNKVDEGIPNIILY